MLESYSISVPKSTRVSKNGDRVDGFTHGSNAVNFSDGVWNY